MQLARGKSSFCYQKRVERLLSKTTPSFEVVMNMLTADERSHPMQTHVVIPFGGHEFST